MQETHLTHSTETVIAPKSGWQFLDWNELRQYRDLLYFFVWRDIKVLYKQTVLGFGWALIRPFLTMVVFTLVFGRLAKMPSDGVPYPLFSYAGLIAWAYFSSALTGATQSLIGQSNILSKVYFPRVFIPMTPILSKLVDFFISFLFLFLLMFYYGHPPTWQIVFAPVLIASLVLTATGAGLWFSALAIQYRDIKHGIEFLVQLLMYAAPVVWPLSLLPDQYRLFIGIYPMVGIVEGFRAMLLGTTPVPWDLILIGFLTSLIVTVAGAAYFRRTERYFADIA